ncbi:Alpha/beta hydrolase fold-1 [Colletotrichum godetiae]|uniref:Alpha/beta hydrolase fold-1 n=1 Tax=Colletotrichum godetiae TaxID=1209918 RepID=A0AAJ0A5Q2_9PEZI|nr:Alpha/beta hydrolase fold-1 [Colletotrichum godetiae]KAK1656968.1 Alpha/beta hydrolase fold-1 [Colletotrichum godetiae]
MSPSKPTFVLAPGAWHRETCYSPAQRILESRGYPVKAVRYPSVGAEPPTKGINDDANAVRVVLQKLVDEGKEIVLVVHSYGGLVGANAVEGLGYKERMKEGKKGGVITFVYLSAFVVPKGKCMKEMLGGDFPLWIKFEGQRVYAQNPEEMFYHDVEPEARSKAIEQLQHQSAQVFDDIVTYEPWHEIDTMFFFCEEDKALPLAAQQGMASLLGPNAFTYSCKASHSPFLSKPGDVAEGLELAAKVGQQRVSA